jgi:CheY-like chemotaxis protein
MELKEEKIILLADDDSDDTEMFCEALTSIDSTILCHTAVDGREALKILNDLEALPHIIFLDVNMPIMTGWQCLKILKVDERYKKIPVIIISTSAHQREIDIARDLGALCYFSKPNDFNQLKEVLQEIIMSLGADLPNALKNKHFSGSLLTCFSTQ